MCSRACLQGGWFLFVGPLCACLASGRWWCRWTLPAASAALRLPARFQTANSHRRRHAAAPVLSSCSQYLAAYFLVLDLYDLRVSNGTWYAGSDHEQLRELLRTCFASKWMLLPLGQAFKDCIYPMACTVKSECMCITLKTFVHRPTMQGCDGDGCRSRSFEPLRSTAVAVDFQKLRVQAERPLCPSECCHCGSVWLGMLYRDKAVAEQQADHLAKAAGQRLRYSAFRLGHPHASTVTQRMRCASQRRAPAPCAQACHARLRRRCACTAARESRRDAGRQASLARGRPPTRAGRPRRSWRARTRATRVACRARWRWSCGKTWSTAAPPAMS